VYLNTVRAFIPYSTTHHHLTITANTSNTVAHGGYSTDNARVSVTHLVVRHTGCCHHVQGDRCLRTQGVDGWYAHLIFLLYPLDFFMLHQWHRIILGHCFYLKYFHCISTIQHCITHSNIENQRQLRLSAVLQ
jgi:hypothetical protein